jgi:hypothetical protein
VLEANQSKSAADACCVSRVDAGNKSDEEIEEGALMYDAIYGVLFWGRE